MSIATLKKIFRILTLLAIIIVASPWHVFAHTGIAQTVPDHDAILARPPTLLHFSFNGQVTVTNARLTPVDENNIQAGNPITIRLPRNRIGQSTAFGEVIDLDIPTLLPGRYQVVFQVVTIDGHYLSDDCTFTVLAP